MVPEITEGLKGLWERVRCRESALACALPCLSCPSWRKPEPGEGQMLFPAGSQTNPYVQKKTFRRPLHPGKKCLRGQSGLSTAHDCCRSRSVQSRTPSGPAGALRRMRAPSSVSVWHRLRRASLSTDKTIRAVWTPASYRA